MKRMPFGPRIRSRCPPLRGAVERGRRLLRRGHPLPVDLQDHVTLAQRRPPRPGCPARPPQRPRRAGGGRQPHRSARARGVSVCSARPRPALDAAARWSCDGSSPSSTDTVCLPAAAHQPDRHARTDGPRRDVFDDVARRFHLLAVDLGDHVAGVQPRLGRGAAGGHLADVGRRHRPPAARASSGSSSSMSPTSTPRYA